MNTIHITNGDVAADSLRTALREAGRNDRVEVLRDDLAIGPLCGSDSSPDVRAAFWRQVTGDEARDFVQAFSEQAAALAQVVAAAAPVVVWHAQSAADQLMLRRVCYHLSERPQRLNEVRLSIEDLAGSGTLAQQRADHATSVGMFAPDLLRAHLSDAAPISVLRIGRLALEWQAVKQADAEMRRWRDNLFTSGRFAELDALVLAHARAGWQRAAEVAAKVMTADTGLLVSDLLVLWRLRELAASGHVHLRGDRNCWQTLELSVADSSRHPSLSQA